MFFFIFTLIINPLPNLPPGGKEFKPFPPGGK